MRKILFLFQLLLVALSTTGQDTINITDASGKKQGKWVKKDPKGNVIYQGQFKNDKPFGNFKYYYDNGTLRMEAAFSDNGNTVRSTMFFGNGNTMAKGKMVSEKKDSVWRYYSDKGYLLKIEKYNKGIKEGEWINYAADSSIAKIENYKNDKLHGPIKEFYSKNQLRMEGTYVNGAMDGKVTHYFPDGTVSVTGNYKNGIKDGTWKYNFNEGKQKSQEIYKNGKLIKEQRDAGTFEDFYPSGFKKSVSTYKNSQLHGPYVEYYDTGKVVKETIPGQNGFPDEVVEKIIGQKIKISCNYKDGKLNGKHITYKEDGNIDKIEYYENGVPVKKEQ